MKNKKILALMLSLSCLCGSFSAALATETDTEATLKALIPTVTYEVSTGNEGDPLADGHHIDTDEDTAQRYVSGTSSKTSHYSKYTQKTYSVPSGYNVFDGIDVSYWNGSNSDAGQMINWNSVVQDGIDYAFVRVGYRSVSSSGGLYKDKDYTYNLSGAANAGIPVGAYVFSQALTTAEAIQEAKFALDCIKGYDVTLPIVMDYEYYDGGRLNNGNISAQQKTENALAFCMTISEAGYTPMVYASKSFFESDMNDSQLDSFTSRWLAHYTTNTSYSGNYDHWQYSASGNVAGITTVVDMNFFFTTAAQMPTSGNSAQRNNVKGFSDVYDTDWYASAIEFVYDNSLMTGTAAAVFEPEASMSRAMLAQVLYNIAGNGEIVSYDNSYSDVGTDWYTNAVAWAKEYDVMSGNGDGTFAPEASVTREEITKAFYNFAQTFGIDTSKTASYTSFPDANDVATFASIPMQWAYANGIINGSLNAQGVTYLNPKSETQRAECAQILKNFFNGIGAPLL